jgi:hypothetical protein
LVGRRSCQLTNPHPTGSLAIVHTRFRWVPLPWKGEERRRVCETKRRASGVLRGDAEDAPPVECGRNSAQAPFTNHHRHSLAFVFDSMMQWRSYRTRRRAQPIPDRDRSSETTPPMELIMENCRLKLFLHAQRAPQKDSANRKIHHAEPFWQVRYSAKKWQRELWRRPKFCGKDAGLSSRQWRMLNIFRPPTTRSPGVMRVKVSLERVE